LVDVEDTEKTVMLHKPALLSPPTPPTLVAPPSKVEITHSRCGTVINRARAFPQKIKITPLVDRIVVRLWGSPARFLAHILAHPAR
jgi:hypothetical protein